MVSDNLQKKIQNLPSCPGCYIFKHDQDILYIGKAKNLQKRVNQYFIKAHSYRLMNLVNLANDVEIFVTENDVEALILEHNLIKEHQPKYNALLKDDKKYPYILVTNEKYPRIIFQRSVNKKSGKYFGPFPNGTSALEMIELLNRVFTFRKCVNMPKELCLYYYIGQCDGPCVNKIDPCIYEQQKKDVERFLSGYTKIIEKQLLEKMHSAASTLDFERAQELKITLEKVRHFSKTQHVEFKDNSNSDFISFYNQNNVISITIFFYRKGKLLSKINHIFESEEHDETNIIERFIFDFYQKNPKPKNLFLENLHNQEVLAQAISINVSTPKMGPKRDILNLCFKNAQVAWKENSEKIITMRKNKDNLVVKMINFFGKDITNSIELVDTSHIQGSYYVGAIVHFSELEKKVKLFRKYDLSDQVKASNDPKAIYLTLTKHFQKNKKPPQFLFVDGAIAQLRAAKKVKEELNLPTKIYALAKDKNHRTAKLIAEDEQIIDLNNQKEIFNFLSIMQDTIHNYAINFFKKQSTKGLLWKSSFESIPGVGPKTASILRKNYGSIEDLRKTSIESLSKIVSAKIAKKIIKFVNK